MKLKYGKGIFPKWRNLENVPVVEASPEAVYELQKSVWFMSVCRYPLNVEWKYHDGEMGAIYVPVFGQESTYEFILRIVQKKEEAK